MKNILRHKLFKFLRNNDGLAYLEFALCLPFLVALLMGSIEVTRFILIAQKVEKTAVTVSDVVSQGSTISHTDLDNIITAAGQVMKPYTFTTNGFVIISSVTQTGAYTGLNPPIIKWQYDSSGSTGSWTQPSQVGTVGHAATLPAGFTLNDKDNIIITEVFYNYAPIIATNDVISGMTIYKIGLYKPRLGDLSTLSFLFPVITKGALL